MFIISPDDIICRSLNDIKKLAEKQNLILDLGQFNFKPINAQIENEITDNEDFELELMTLNIEIINNYKDVMLSPNRLNWEKVIRELDQNKMFEN